MATPIGSTSNGDLWHLSIDDLLAPLPAAPRLGGAGPFVINLTTSTAPLETAKDFCVEPCTHVYQVQRNEDHRPRFRLRLGPFVTEDEADAALLKVRDTYPGALTATAETDDLRAILAWQAKRDALRIAAERAQAQARALEAQTAVFVPASEAARASPAEPPASSAGPQPTTTAAFAPQPASAAARALDSAKAADAADLPSLEAPAIPVLRAAVATRKQNFTPLSVRRPAAALAATSVGSLHGSDGASGAAAPATAETTATLRAPGATQPAPTEMRPAEVRSPLPEVRLPTPEVRSPTPAAPAPAVVAVGPAKSPAAGTRSASQGAPTPDTATTGAARVAPVSAVPGRVASFETTQTIRPLTTVEVENEEAPRWFVIQLSLSDTAFDPESLPNLDIFSEYRLYSVVGFDQGRVIHALRLGFFSAEVAAAAVAGYLGAYYDKPTVKRVSAAERERFAVNRLEARKDIGATGRHAVIEITNERVVRERREAGAAASAASKHAPGAPGASGTLRPVPSSPRPVKK